MDEHSLTRREFTREGALALLAGVTITITSCGNGDDSQTAPSPQPSGEVGAISANHGHTAVITDAQLDAGNALVLNIQGTAPHPHTVQITANEVQQIAAGQRVMKESSSDDSHTHFVTFN